MELRTGYKLTAVGILPDDWEVKQLGDLGSVVRGSSPRPAGDSRYFHGSFIPWLTVAALTNIPDHQLTVFHTVGALTELGAKRSRVLDEGAVIIANSGATLGVAKVLGVRCCANDGIAALVGRTSGEKHFICYYINTQTNRLRDEVASGNGQPNLNTRLIREIAVPFPSISEQKAIAATLSDVDMLLDGLTRLIAKKRDLNKAAVQQLLSGRTRLPGFAGKWAFRALDSVAEVLKGSGLTKSQLNPGASRPCILYGELFTTYGRVIQHIVSRTDCEDGLRSRAGDVLMPGSTTTNGIDLATASALPFDDVALGADMLVIRPDGNEVNSAFLAYYLTSARRAEIAELTQGITIHHLYGSNLKRLPICLPSLPEQSEIARMLADMEKELNGLEARRAKTQALKQAMLKSLLTGRIRLVTPEQAHG